MHDGFHGEVELGHGVICLQFGKGGEDVSNGFDGLWRFRLWQAQVLIVQIDLIG